MKFSVMETTALLMTLLNGVPGTNAAAFAPEAHTPNLRASAINRVSSYVFSATTDSTTQSDNTVNKNCTSRCQSLTSPNDRVSCMRDCKDRGSRPTDDAVDACKEDCINQSTNWGVIRECQSKCESKSNQDDNDNIDDFKYDDKNHDDVPSGKSDDQYDDFSMYDDNGGSLGSNDDKKNDDNPNEIDDGYDDLLIFEDDDKGSSGSSINDDKNDDKSNNTTVEIDDGYDDVLNDDDKGSPGGGSSGNGLKDDDTPDEIDDGYDDLLIFEDDDKSPGRQNEESQQFSDELPQLMIISHLLEAVMESTTADPCITKSKSLINCMKDGGNILGKIHNSELCLLAGTETSTAETCDDFEAEGFCTNSADCMRKTCTEACWDEYEGWARCMLAQVGCPDICQEGVVDENSGMA